MTLRVTFLGTSGAIPTTDRNPSGLHVNRDGDQLLFDAGEGTQRQLMRYAAGFAVSDVFVTHLHGDHVYGLPGLLETWSFNDRSEPLTVHCPPGTREDLLALLTALGGQPSYPLDVVEVAPGDVALEADDYRVRAFATDHRTRSVGYALVESDRRGRFDREHAEALGVPVGPAFSRLHAGEPVELEDGTVVEPEEVVGPARPGRTVVYTGDTRPCETVVEAAAGADLLIHDGTFADEHAERAVETRHSTAREAAEVAARAGAERLVLTHVSSRYAGGAGQLAEQAREAFDGEVTVARDGLTLDVELPE
ncbi:MAG: ribonuclease Z [Halobacteriales archaeon]|nr:ribonuclease Z [Halobacteriales archaeon]